MSTLQLLDRPKNIIYVVWHGGVTAEDWLHQTRALMAETDWPAITRLIADVQMVSDTAAIGEKEMEAVTALLGTQPRAALRKRSAVLAKDLFGKARIFSTLVARLGTSMVVFNHLDTACNFLGIDAAETGQALEQLHLRLRGGGRAFS